jgi:hypothetical protein
MRGCAANGMPTAGVGFQRQVLEALKAVGITKMKIFLKGTRMFM